jgi:small subunit ribosomal protein S18
MANKDGKVCPIDAAGIKFIDYKDIELLKKYLTKFNKIVPRYYSGVSLSNQKKLAAAIKRARYMALLPFVVAHRGAAQFKLSEGNNTPSAAVKNTSSEGAEAVGV